MSKPDVRTLQEVELAQLHSHPANWLIPSKVNKLAKSIKVNGLDKPIEVAFYPNGEYWVEDGHHRVAAHLKLKRTHILALVKQKTAEEYNDDYFRNKWWELAVNPPSDLETAEWLNSQLPEAGSGSVGDRDAGIAQLADEIGKSIRWVRTYLQIVTAPVSVQKICQTASCLTKLRPVWVWDETSPLHKYPKEREALFHNAFDKLSKPKIRAQAKDRVAELDSLARAKEEQTKAEEQLKKLEQKVEDGKAKSPVSGNEGSAERIGSIC